MAPVDTPDIPEVLRTEDNPKWIRGVVGGRTVVDSRATKLVWEVPWYPTWYFPVVDVHDPGIPSTARPELPDHVRIDWHAVDRWFEEDIEVFVHPRSPHTRIDALASSRHIVVRIDGVTIADTHRPTVLLETGLPPRSLVNDGGVGGVDAVDVHLGSWWFIARPARGLTADSSVRGPPGPGVRTGHRAERFERPQ